MEWNAAVKDRIKARLKEKENTLASYACKSSDAIRFHEMLDDVRLNFSHDSDKIVNSYCYSRYIDKTQVFYLVENIP